jgi:hypothetical protein
MLKIYIKTPEKEKRDLISNLISLKNNNKISLKNDIIKNIAIK